MRNPSTTTTTEHTTPITKTTAKKRSGLSMQIYSAMLGGTPQIDAPVPTTRPRLKMRLKVEAKLEHAHASPFQRTTLRQHIEHCAAYAARALDQARERLSNARPKPVDSLGDPAEPAPLKSIVLVGPAVRVAKADASATSRAA